MKRAAITFALVALVGQPLRPAAACPMNGDFSCDRPARWAARHDPEDARIAITTENGEVTLLLTRDVVALQLSDHTFHRVDRQLRSKERDDDDEDNPVADAIRTAVLSGVRAALDHSAECSIRDVREVEYRHGELRFTLASGERLFHHVVFDDSNVMESFSESDAQAFVREFHRVKSSSHS